MKTVQTDYAEGRKMTLDEAVEWLRFHVGDLRSAARVLRESPWGAKLADTAAVVDRAADKGTRAIAALEAAQMGLRYTVRVWVLSDEIEWSEAEIDEAVESIICDAKKEASND